MEIKIKATLSFLSCSRLAIKNNLKNPKMTTSTDMDTGEAENLFSGGGSTN